MKNLFFKFIIFFLISGCASNFENQFTHKSYPSEIIGIYQNSLESLNFVRKGRCQMHPNCSSFGRQAFEKHSFFKAYYLTCERLVRCGRDSGEKLKIIQTDSGLKFNDPVPD
ncbi:MAG: membrane protein insertion efficiency factor YidD [Desulfobacteraceae bacterium]|jgi:putative component of membrane protein insertase Oxa1/YidC/SpoIIIJ protein YidD